MNKNSFVACGGTGAHVMLAMVRLHVLGSPFGFFISKDKNFPDLFLVDQDYNEITEDGEERTAWGKAKELIKTHPGRYKPQEKFGLQGRPNLEVITPLPVGMVNSGLNNLPNSELLKLITSKRQREIEYGRCMMASPALGSLLFSLKEYDKGSAEINNDKAYAELTDNRRGGNVVVCGSILGGTGASVTPALALRLHEREANVMAVLIHRCFKFRTDDLTLESQRKAKIRNKQMVENAAGGLAYSGQKLASDVATVLVGVPELVLRDYSEDNQQACKDSYAHVIGALAAIRHLLSDEEEIGEGLYGVWASNPSKLTGDIKIGEGKHSTLNDLVGQATCLVYVLELYCDALEKYEPHQFRGITGLMHFISTGSFESIQLRICKSTYDAVDKNILKVKHIARELKKIKENYDGLLGWLEELDLGYRLYSWDEQQFLKIQYNHLSRIREESLPPPLDGGRRGIKAGKELGEEEYIALALFHWLANWIKAWWEKGKPPQPSSFAVKVYWPPTITEGCGYPNKPPGELVKIKSTDVARTLRDYFFLKDISPNGWPHPVAVVDEFKFKIEQKDSISIRKLELLLLGRALKLLNLEKLKPEKGIKELIKKEYPKGIAQYRLVHYATREIYGFSSPETLLCPTPDTSDKDWQELWEEINHYTAVDDHWQTSEQWGYDARKARSCIANWIKHLEGKIQSNDCWRILAYKFDSEGDETSVFGISEWLPVAGNEEKIPLPVYGSSIVSPNEFIENQISYDDPNDNGIRDQIEGFDEFRGFEFIRDLSIPGLEHHQSMIWRDHLDKLQEEYKIFAWWEDVENNQVGIMTEFQQEVIYIKNLRVIDLDNILIKTCIPLIQRPVPGSDVEENSLKFPDLPLLPKYISLAKASHEGRETWIESNWSGMHESPYQVNEQNKIVQWTLHLAGRPASETLRLTYDGIEPVEAHWMIWPGFRAQDKEERQWKAYYIYEHSTKESLEAKPILDKGDKLSEPKKRPTHRLGPSRAVEFDAKEGIHTGGPPVALCVYDHTEKENLGLYTVRLAEFSKTKPSEEESEWKIAIDFGTSHTVAAVRTDEENKPITLQAELGGPARNDEKLSLHVSENWPKDPSKRSEMQLDMWRPTYVEEGKQSETLLSDIWSLKNLSSVAPSEIEECWEPMTHYLIPPTKLARQNASDYSISGFQWQMTDENFNDIATWLRRRFLGMAIEILVADVVRAKKKLPENIQFTFTYPLRGIYTGDTGRYENIVIDVLKNSKRDLGFEVVQSDGLLYSNSHAAAGIVGTGRPFEIGLVSDLGTRILDVFISTSDIDGVEKRFEEVADSAGLGANLLLQIMASESNKYLPESWGDDAETCLANLRAWMCLVGSDKLFGEFPNFKSIDLGLQGFRNSKEDIYRANASRMLIDRYFQLIVDFLARYLVAYIAKEIWRNENLSEYERKHLKLFVQLQGNGWRLWYGSANYYEIQRKIEEDVRSRAEYLWAGMDRDMAKELSHFELWHEAMGIPNPKLGPICNAVGKSNNPYDIDTYKFPLSKVLLSCPGAPYDSREWFQPLPYTVENPKNTVLRLVEFDPPVSIYPSGNSDEEIRHLEDYIMRNINHDISEGMIFFHNTLDAPIASIIWENVLRSSKFREMRDGNSERSGNGFRES